MGATDNNLKVPGTHLQTCGRFHRSVDPRSSAGHFPRFIRPGRPIESDSIESLNGRFRHECLKLHCFTALDEARDVIEIWRFAYNHFRPHSSLGG